MKKLLTKKIVFLIFNLFLFSLFLPKSVYAQFQRYPQNPIIRPEFFYEKDGVYAPTVVYKNNQYFMWYSSLSQETWTISFATSSDGINWEKYQNNPVILPNPNNPFVACEKGAHDPEVIWNPDLQKYQIWFVVNCEWQPTGEPRYWIKYGESIDGINWQIIQEPVLAPLKDPFSWEAEGISSPTVWYENGNYKMWYCARDRYGNWRIGLAFSLDGKNWEKFFKNPIISPTESWELTHICGSEILKNNNQYQLFYYGANIWPPTYLIYALSEDGIAWQKPENNPLLSPNETEKYLAGPDIIIDQLSQKLYYSALINDRWHISLLIKNLPSPTPTPTPSLFPSISLSPSPSVTPTNFPTPSIPFSSKSPIVIIPGLMASWNKEALFYNKKVSYDQWKIPNFVKEYTGIIKTFKNLGYKEGEDLYVFAYDWRQKIEDSVSDLLEFIEKKVFSKNSPKKIILVGHSLGGIISRIFTQKYPEKVKKIISVGSPHQGAVQVYKPLEAGEIDRENTFLWLGQKIILILNKNSFETDRQTFQKKFPVGFDLFPIFDFLKNEKGEIIPLEKLTIKNNFLTSYNKTVNQIFPLLYIIYGEKNELKTPAGFYIKKPDWHHQTLGNYPDGQPTKKFFNLGDYTVLSQSAKLGNNLWYFPFDHGEIITKKEAIKKILEILEINYQENQIVEGEKTTISPALIFMIKSPAQIEVNFDKDKYVEKDEGIIFISPAKSGKYTLYVKGKELGKYTVVIGQIGENNDLWEKIEGEIKKTPPSAQIDTYIINFDSKNPQSIFSLSSSNEENSNNKENNNNQKDQNSSLEKIAYNSVFLKPQSVYQNNKNEPKILGVNKENQNKNNFSKIEKNKNNKKIFLIIFIFIILIAILKVLILKKTNKQNKQF